MQVAVTISETQLPKKIKVNEKASFYDLTEGTYTYAGTSGKVETYSKMAGMTYSASDADFGITKRHRSWKILQTWLDQQIG